MRQHLLRRLLDRHPGIGGQQRGDQRRVVGRLVREGAGHQGVTGLIPFGQPGLQLEGVGEVAVVTQGDAAGRGRPERRLGVLPDAGAGGRVPGVADGQVAAQRVEGRLVEDLRHQAHVLEDHDLGAVADRDAGGFLAAVLERVETEVGELGHLLARGPDAEDAAGVLGATFVGVEVVVQPTICSCHCLMRIGSRRASLRGAARSPAILCSLGFLADEQPVGLAHRCAPAPTGARRFRGPQPHQSAGAVAGAGAPAGRGQHRRRCSCSGSLPPWPA